MSKLPMVAISASVFFLGCVAYRSPPASTLAAVQPLPQQDQRQTHTDGAQEIPDHETAYGPWVFLMAVWAQRDTLSMNTALERTLSMCAACEKRDASRSRPCNRLECEAYARQVVTELYWPGRVHAQAGSGPVD
jgi:hypothetical protein